MTDATVTAFPRKTKTTKPAAIVLKPKSAATKKKMFRQRIASYGVGVVALVLTVLSLDHLATGVQMLTKADVLHSWAMAIGIDCGFIGLELAQLCTATEAIRKIVHRWACPAVVITLIISALMNANAFAAGASNMTYAVCAAALGISIPAMIYVLTRVAVAMWIDGER